MCPHYYYYYHYAWHMSDAMHNILKSHCRTLSNRSIHTHTHAHTRTRHILVNLQYYGLMLWVNQEGSKHCGGGKSSNALSRQALSAVVAPAVNNTQPREHTQHFQCISGTLCKPLSRLSQTHARAHIARGFPY